MHGRAKREHINKKGFSGRAKHLSQPEITCYSQFGETISIYSFHKLMLTRERSLTKGAAALFARYSLFRSVSASPCSLSAPSKAALLPFLN